MECRVRGYSFSGVEKGDGRAGGDGLASGPGGGFGSSSDLAPGVIKLLKWLFSSSGGCVFWQRRYKRSYLVLARCRCPDHPWCVHLFAFYIVDIGRPLAPSDAEKYAGRALRRLRRVFGSRASRETVVVSAPRTTQGARRWAFHGGTAVVVIDWDRLFNHVPHMLAKLYNTVPPPERLLVGRGNRLKPGG